MSPLPPRDYVISPSSTNNYVDLLYILRPPTVVVLNNISIKKKPVHFCFKSYCEKNIYN